MHEIGYAIRRLRGGSMFTIAATLTLAVAIVATASVDGVLLKTFPFGDPERVLTMDGRASGVTSALTHVLAKPRIDVLASDEGHLTLIPHSSVDRASSPATDDSSGAITGSLIDSENGQPVPYGTVTLLGTDRTIFTDANGGFHLLGLAPGKYAVRARQIGYAPRDTTVDVGQAPAVTTLTLRLTRIPAILDLVTVEGRRGKGCVAPGIPDMASNPGLAAIMTQVEENVARFRVLVNQYPFHYAREERLVVRFDPGGEVTQRLDTVTYESQGDRPYRVGSIVPADSDTVAIAGRYAHRSMYLPTFAALGDTAFLATHCFVYEGKERLGGRQAPELIRIDFRPSNAIAVPDVEGSVYLDAQRLVIRRAVFQMTKPQAARPPVLGLSVMTTFREFLPLVPVFDSVESETRLPPAPPPEGPPHGELVRGAGPATFGGGEAKIDRALIQRYRVVGFAFDSREPGEQETLLSEPGALPTPVGALQRPSVAPPGATDTAVGDLAVLTGRVSQPDGTPVSGAVVRLLGTADTTITDDAGRFALHAQESGAFMVAVRRLGFRSERFAVTLSHENPPDLGVTLTRLVPVLPAVTTTAAERSAYREVGFEQRMQAGIGQFLTYDQILEEHALQFTELLRGMHAVRLVQRPRQFGTALLGTRLTKGAPTCVSLVVDGVPQPLMDEHSATGATLIGAESPDNLIDVSNVGAIEVYEPSERPAGLGAQDWCVLVVVWTRTRLGLPLGASTAPDIASSVPAIHGRAVFPNDSGCVPPPAATDTMEFTVYAVLQAGSSGDPAARAWGKYRDSVLTTVDRWAVLPSELSLPAFSSSFEQQQPEDGKQTQADQSADAAPTLSDVIVFALDSAGGLTDAHVAASSLSGAMDTALLAAVERAAAAHAFPRFPSTPGKGDRRRLDLLVSSAEPQVGTTAAILGRLDVPVWRLSRAAALLTDASEKGVTATSADRITVEMIVGATGRIVGRTVRVLNDADSDGNSTGVNNRRRLVEQLNALRFTPAQIGTCSVPQWVVQSVAVPPVPVETHP